MLVSALPVFAIEGQDSNASLNASTMNISMNSSINASINSSLNISDGDVAGTVKPVEVNAPFEVTVSKKVITPKEPKKTGSKSVKVSYGYKKTCTSSSARSSSVRSKSSSGSSFDAIMRSGARYGYSRGISSASGMMSAGRGDCWAMSEYLSSRLRSAGYTVRVVQYATAYSSRHRIVQVYQNGRWTTVPYGAYGYNRMFTG